MAWLRQPLSPGVVNTERRLSAVKSYVRGECIASTAVYCRMCSQQSSPTVGLSWRNFSKSRVTRAIMGQVSPITPPLGLFVIHALGLVMINLCAKFEIPITHYKNAKCNAERIKCGDFG